MWRHITGVEQPAKTFWLYNNEKLIDLILTLPAHSAYAERGFSEMKLVKSDWRSCLRPSILSDLLFTMLHAYDIPSVWPYWCHQPLEFDRTKNTEIKPKNIRFQTGWWWRWWRWCFKWWQYWHSFFIIIFSISNKIINI